ncbi:MAG TPA: glycosyltransferase family 39 protein [Planctomycetota bacterium]|jgi:4-amino-4-deoxy-L-arabinose transferase-like glycosyltransferase|nr:glycosyltransferase family 39 protein [Planctomycetota bacterium]
MNQSIPFGRGLALILILDAALLFSVIGRAPLSRIDEGQIAEVAREMVTGRDWLTPRIGGVTFPAYPPLAYWLLAASGSCFGFSEFAMRLPTALAGLALIAVSAQIARRLAGDAAGLTVAGMLATLPAFFVQSGVCRADILTMAFATAAFDRFLAWAEGEKKIRDLAFMYLFTALGILTKGPLAVAMLGLGGLAWFLLRRQWKLLLEMKLWIGIPAALLIVVPWYLAMYKINGWAFINENLFLENLDAYTRGYQQKRGRFFYFSQVHFLLPWLLVLPLAWKVRRSPGVALSLAWFGLVALFFTASSAKRVNYLAYWCPSLALSAGTIFAAVCAEAPQLLKRGFLALGGLAAAGGGVVAALPAGVWTGDNVSKIAAQLPTIGLVAAAAGAVIAGIAWRRGPQAAGLGMAGVLVAALFVYGFLVNVRVNPENGVLADFCRQAARKVPAGETLYVPAPEGAEGLVHFYAGAALPLRAGDPGYYLAGQSQQERLVKDGRNVQILDSMLDHRGRSRYLLRVHP